MTEDDKAKQERLAAARKRVEEMKKKKKKGTKKAGASKEEEEKEQDTTTTAATETDNATPADEKASPEEPEGSPKEGATADAKGAVEEEAADDVPASPSQSQTQPSLAQQSKMRSASFRQGSISAGSPGPLSPGAGGDGETATDIYRKHVARIEELESENKRLSKDASDAEKRWKKTEEELADLREADGDGNGVAAKAGSDGQVDKLKSEIAALERQNSQLQQQVSRAGGATRHGASPSISAGAAGDSSTAELEAQLASKSSTIETMELEISKLRAQVDRDATSSTTEREQIAALEERLQRSEKTASQAQQELADLRRNLDRTTEKAVREGSERTSAETKLRALEHELADAVAAGLEAEKKADGLDKKVATLTTLHKEHDSRTQALRKDKEKAEKEVVALKGKVETLEGEASRLRSRKSAEVGGGGMDDDGVDELEDEERRKLEKKVRDLEAEVHDLRRGAWQEKRRELSGSHDATSPGGGFQDVDLGGATSPMGRKQSHQHQHQHQQHGGLGDFFQSGINALTGQSGGHGDEDDGFLSDEDADFDGEAFRKAQEEDALKRVERVRELKRGLADWQGWRLDLVEIRRGGREGLGEVFEV